MAEKECCLHPGHPNFRCPECKKTQTHYTEDEKKKNREDLLRWCKDRRIKGTPSSIPRHEDEDMPFGE